MKKEQLDLFNNQPAASADKGGAMEKKTYSNPFHTDEEMSRLEIDDAPKLEGEEHKMLLDMVLKAVGESREQDENKIFKVNIQLVSNIAYAISKKRGAKELAHEEYMGLVRSIVKTLGGYKFSPSVFSLLKKRGESAPDAFGSALKERPKFGIEKSLPIGDQDEDKAA